MSESGIREDRVGAWFIFFSLLLTASGLNGAELISANGSGTDSGNDRSYFPELSADGRRGRSTSWTAGTSPGRAVRVGCGDGAVSGV